MKTRVLFMACALAGAAWGCETPVDAVALRANEWQLREMTTEKGTVTLPERVPTILFADSSRVSGFSGCNRFTGKYKLSGGRLSLSPLITTRMLCTGGMDFEQQFQRLLAEAKRISLLDGELTIGDGKGKLSLVFVPRQAAETLPAPGASPAGDEGPSPDPAG
ncbi:MAG: META domain-containing protein [Odoribacteraceae bacterium]|jgi:heat shock protein HslJ|nr:META domain-containing protein [Odoribacteraceae bacterium]